MPTIKDNFTKAYRVEFDARANVESLMAAVKEILGRSGCPECGRMGRFELEIDPRVQLQREIAGVKEITEIIKAETLR